jgi:hypothetical protein
MMAVIRIIPAGDLELKNGDLVVLGYTDATRIQFIRQKIASRFKFFINEWFLDQREGIPYYRDVFVKRPNIPLIRSLFRRVLIKTTGVLDVPRMSLVYDSANRSLAFDFQARVTGGEVVVRPEDADFIVSVAAVR